MRSEWTQSFANAGVSLVMINELENLEDSYKSGETSQEAYEKRKAELEKMLNRITN